MILYSYLGDVGKTGVDIGEGLSGVADAIDFVSRSNSLTSSKARGTSIVSDGISLGLV